MVGRSEGERGWHLFQGTGSPESVKTETADVRRETSEERA